jgi:CheY-like chemotaxis protein
MTAPTQNRPARARQILLVDDNPEFTTLLKGFMLSHRPGAWIVHTADHYAPALTCLKDHAVDLVVLDLNMPVMDGLQFLTLLKRTHPELPVVILTGVATPENRANCLKNGAALFFDKTEVAGSPEKIYAALESVASAPTVGFRGMLRQVGLPDVLQMECLGRKSSVLEVTASNETGRIFIEDGSIVHAESRALQGEPALFQLLSLGGGEFHLKSFAKPARQTIDGQWESLLMESARLRDEAAGAVAADAAEAAAQVEPGAPSPEPPRRIEEIVLCSSTGELLYEWQAKNVNHRIQLLELAFKTSVALGKSSPLTRGERLEVESPDARIIMLLHPDRRVFVRSAAAPDKMAT